MSIGLTGGAAETNPPLAGGTASSAVDDATADPAVATTGQSTPIIDRDHFVITTTIERDGQTIDQHRVIFDSGIAYDVVGDGSRFITVFGDDHVTLLDRMTQVRSEVPQSTLLDVTHRAAGAARQSVHRDKLGVDVRPVRRGNDYAASFGPFEYNLTTIEPAAASIAADYARFADAAVRLNVMQQMGFPPFARLALSRRIASDGRMPIQSTITLSHDQQRTVYRVEATLANATDADRARADRFRSMVKLFQPVALSEFPARTQK